MMTFDYDTLDTLPTTKFEHAQTTPNAESNAFNNFSLDVKCDNVYRFVRQGAITGVDLKTYDFGQLVVSSSYSTAALIGELYVDYVVELAKPSHGVAVAQRFNTSGAAATPFSTIISSKGVAQPIIYYSSTQFQVIRPGEYMVSGYGTGAGMGVSNTPTLVAGYTAGAEIIQVMPIVTNAAATVSTTAFKVRAGAGDRVDCTNWMVGSTGIVIFITECDYTAFT